MQDWLKTFHGGNHAFPPVEMAVKVAVTLALGLLVGFEREWSNKDIGVRTFAMTALLGLPGTLLGPPLLILSGVAVWILIVFANLRGLQIARKLEATTSTALAVVFLLGVLVGEGHLFTPVACAISWQCSCRSNLSFAHSPEGSSSKRCAARWCWGSWDLSSGRSDPEKIRELARRGKA